MTIVNLIKNVDLTTVKSIDQSIAFSRDDALTTRMTVDIISIGSVLRTELHDAQWRTFGSHGALRNFFRLTEKNDTDQECFKGLTRGQVKEVAKFCSNMTSARSLLARRLRKFLRFHSYTEGWLCAQKRPLDGLYSVLMQYRDEKMEIPHYLFVVDDDTYVNVDALNEILYHEFPYDEPLVVAGCLIPSLPRFKMNFPYGGFGTFLSRAAIQRLLQPIHCRENDDMRDSFSRFACWCLEKNLVGEKTFFTDGMSVMDLMYKYAADQLFMEVRNWQIGFCFHSDHAIGYFFNMYHISVPYSELDANVPLTDSLRKEYRFKALTDKIVNRWNWQGECENENKCTADSPVCHYMQPSQMDKLVQGKDVV
jgi:hypothetical protein